MHLKLCKRVLVVPWYAPNIGCRTELGRLPLSQEIKCAIHCYMTRLSYNISNDLIKSAAKYALTHNTNFQRICQQIKSETQMHAQNVTSNYETKRIKKRAKKLKSNFVTTWKETVVAQSDESRPKVTYKQVQLNYNLQNYVINIKTIPHGACLAKLMLSCHLLRIQTGKYEWGGGPIPVESMLCR